MNKKKVYDLFKLFAFIFCFAGIPFIMIITGFFYTRYENKVLMLNNLTNDVSVIHSQLEFFSNQENFWGLLFEENIAKNTKVSNNIEESMQNFANSLKELNQKYDFDYLVYNPKKGIIASLSEDTLGGSEKERKMALNYVWKAKFRYNPLLNPKLEEALGKVFGPQFYITHFFENRRKDMRLCWTDSLYKRRLIWNCSINKCLVLTFLKPESLTDLSCLKTFLENMSGDIYRKFNYSIKDTNTNTFLHTISSESRKEEIQKASNLYEKNRLTRIETEHYWVFPKYLRPGVYVFVHFDKKNIEGIEPSGFWWFGILIFFILGIVISIYGWRVIYLHKLDTLSIKWKLAFLFFFANGLPLMVLIYIGNNFLQNAKDDYMQKIMKEGTAFLQDYDEKYELEFSRCLVRKEKILKEIKTNNNHNLFTKKDVEKLYCGISSDTWTLYLVASSGQTLVRTTDGLFDDDDVTKTPDGRFKACLKLDSDAASRFERYSSGQIILTQKIGYFLLHLMNEKPVKEKNATEIELFVETTLRQSLDIFVSDLINKLGSFTPFGFGQNVHPALIDSITLRNNKGYDYLLIVALKMENFLSNYLSKSILQANRNELGVKVIVLDEFNQFYPKTEESQSILIFRKRLSPYPLDKGIIINHKGTDYIAMGFDSKHFERCSIIGLYPLFLIDEYVSTKRNEFIIITLASLLVTFILSSIIIRSFLLPLSEIHNGARAIENKNFQYRLPQLGRDEFGAMGNIFNQVVVDLEELSVAGTIQEQLLPNSTINTGNFKLYGKSVPMTDLAGDYFDFIDMGDNKFSVALGDVAGHGVGASLIMAMAKAGLISLESLWTEPQKLISRLHEMVYKSKTKNQRKIMTFQYMYLDGNTGQAIYSNAGGCSPIIIRKSTETVEELKLPGAVLGAFKKGKFTDTSIQFEPGDAVVFYTDGIVECKNSDGTMLGYDNLKIIFQKCWNEDAEIFYKNIYASYLEYIGGDESNAGDDVTIVVLVFNKPDDSNAETES